MAQRRTSQATAFLTIISWPEGHQREDVARLLADAADLDQRTLLLLLGQTPPMILGHVDSATARRAIEAIVKHGGDAFAPTLDHIASLGPTLKIKDLRIGSGGLHVDLWRGPSATIAPDDIQILVRVRLSESVRKPGVATHGRSPLTSYTHPAASPVAAGWGFGGAYGMAAAIYATRDASTAKTDKDIILSHKLDIHATDGRVFQIDGDKFGYQILGEMRGYSDNENIDKMCELMTHLAPDAVVDPYYSLWRPPSGYQRLRLPNMKINNDDPAFAFYSRWAALMYRHVMGM